MRRPWAARQQAGGAWRGRARLARWLTWLLRSHASAESARTMQRLDMRLARSVQRISSQTPKRASGQSVVAQLTTVKMTG